MYIALLYIIVFIELRSYYYIFLQLTFLRISVFWQQLSVKLLICEYSKLKTEANGALFQYSNNN